MAISNNKICHKKKNYTVVERWNESLSLDTVLKKRYKIILIYETITKISELAPRVFCESKIVWTI